MLDIPLCMMSLILQDDLLDVMPYTTSSSV